MLGSQFVCLHACDVLWVWHLSLARWRVSQVGPLTKGTSRRCGDNYILSVRDGKSGPCAQAGAVYVFQKDFGGMNNWGQVAKLTTTAGSHLSQGYDTGNCDYGRETEVTGNGECPGASCKICTNKVGTGASALNSTHKTHQMQHFGAAVSVQKHWQQRVAVLEGSGPSADRRLRRA
jgi:hypothetical protein